MKRSGAIWLVVGVVAVAALLMYFVVLPQIREGKTVEVIAEKAVETVKDVKQAVKDAAKEVGKVADGGEEAKAQALVKMARLGRDAKTAADDFKAVLEKGTPSAEEVADARAKLAAALKATSEFRLPDNADDTAAAAAAKVIGGAKAALTALDALPADPAAARAAVEDIETKLLMTLPGGDLPKPADAATPAQADDEAAAKTETGERTDDAAVTAVPAFDILRVEKDGSTVIAGRAEPGAKIEIVDGDKVIASADADISGDFAAVLDDPLTAGDHSLTLKATSRDGKATVSEEVATVSVPKDTAGELLAMVTKPGEASKIITMPDSQPVEIAASKDVTSDASDKAVTPADAATTAAAKAEPENASEAAVATPDLPASATDIASSPPLVSQDGTADRTEKQVPADDSAAVSTEAKAENPGRKQPASIPEVLVSAVELEGDKIFVAGNTRPRATVRVYADDAIVAEARADESGRFVAEGIARLAIGNHTIRADVLSVDGARVEFRASVPFFRPEGDLAAVASADAANDAPSIEPLANGAFDKARDEARKALELLKRLYADGKTPTAEELAAARSSAEIALKSLADVHVPADVDPALGAMARKASQDAAAALQKLRPLPADVKAFQAALGEVETIMSAVVKPVSELASADNARKTFTRPVTADSADDEEKAGEADAADVRVTPKADRLARSTNAEKAQLPGSEASPEETDARAVDGTPDAKPDTRTEGRSSTDDGPKVIEQAPLTQSEGSVIIRRGDTLWQISRRVYGKGVRYTTIYMANKTQIDDPDRIMPGQIFSMPGQWLDNAEELHKERLEHEHKGR